MELKLTRHANTRIRQRVKTKQSINLIKKIFKKELFIPIGYDLNKKHVKHCLFYIYNINDFFVACIDENTNEMLTVLFGYEFRNWNISSEAFDDAKLKQIDGLLQSNINLSFSYIELSLMKKNPEKFYFINKYFQKHGFGNEQVKKNKKTKTKQTTTNEVNLELIRDKQKQLREQNINSSQQYEINKEDKKLIEQHRIKMLKYEEENRIKLEKQNKMYSDQFKDINIKLLEIKPTHFLCKIDFDMPESDTNIVNLFTLFNTDLIFKAHRVKNLKNNIQYIFNKEETSIIAKQYLLLKYKNGYDKTIEEYLNDCGFGFFNNNIYLNSLNATLNKTERHIHNGNLDKNLEIINKKFLNRITKN